MIYFSPFSIVVHPLYLQQIGSPRWCILEMEGTTLRILPKDAPVAGTIPIPEQLYSPNRPAEMVAEFQIHNAQEYLREKLGWQFEEYHRCEPEIADNVILVPLEKAETIKLSEFPQ